MSKTNAQVALECAAKLYSGRDFGAISVTRTADAFLKWLNENED